MTKKEWKKLDELTSKMCKEDKNYTCEDCGRSKEQGWQIHWHHFIGRKKTSLRWVMLNSFVLCAMCHSKWEGDPTEAVKMAKLLRGDKWLKQINSLKTKINKKSFEENKYLIDKSLEEIIKSYG